MSSIASVSSIALTGMRAAAADLQVRANNVANVATARFQREVTANQEAAGGGVSTQVQAAGGEGSDVVDDMVGGLSARNDFQTNARVLHAADATLGSLLDVLA